LGVPDLDDSLSVATSNIIFVTVHGDNVTLMGVVSIRGSDVDNKIVVGRSFGPHEDSATPTSSEEPEGGLSGYIESEVRNFNLSLGFEFVEDTTRS
jgi:hypothetical protein